MLFAGLASGPSLITVPRPQHANCPSDGSPLIKQIVWNGDLIHSW